MGYTGAFDYTSRQQRDGQPPAVREWLMKHEDCPGRIFGNKECRLSQNYCTKENCIFEYFGMGRKGTIDALFDI
jgi:hypothetical protein